MDASALHIILLEPKPDVGVLAAMLLVQAQTYKTSQVSCVVSSSLMKDGSWRTAILHRLKVGSSPFELGSVPEINLISMPFSLETSTLLLPGWYGRHVLGLATLNKTAMLLSRHSIETSRFVIWQSEEVTAPTIMASPTPWRST